MGASGGRGAGQELGSVRQASPAPLCPVFQPRQQPYILPPMHVQCGEHYSEMHTSQGNAPRPCPHPFITQRVRRQEGVTRFSFSQVTVMLSLERGHWQSDSSQLCQVVKGLEEKLVTSKNTAP